MNYYISELLLIVKKVMESSRTREKSVLLFWVAVVENEFESDVCVRSAS